MRFAIIIALHMIPLLCSAQISTETRSIYTRKEGLSNNTVTSIIKDNRGFLWVGTSEGLNRFDGRHFTTYFSEAGEHTTLSGNNIYEILQYKPGMLLIATNNGVSILNTLSNRFENDLMKQPALRSGSGIYVRSLFKDAAGHIYINYAGKIDVFDNELRFLYCLTDTPWGKTISGIIIYLEKWVQDSEGRIWMPSDNMGLCLLDEKAKQVYSTVNNPFHYPFMRLAPVRSFFYDEHRQQVFVSYWGEGLEKYDLRTGKHSVQNFKTVAFGEARTINAITLQNNRLICCGTFCIYSLDPETLRYERILEKGNDSGTSFIDCYTVYNDDENIWIGTETKGLFQIPNLRSTVKQIPLPYPIRDYTGGCTGLLQFSKDVLYFAYGEEGLVEVNQQTSQATRYPAPVNVTGLSYITKIYQYDNGHLLVGTLAGLYLFDTRSKKFSRTNFFPAYTDKLIITAITVDIDGDVWISSRLPNALGYYDRKSNQFSYYPAYQIHGRQVFNSATLITHMFRDKKGNVWMSSSKANGEISRYENFTGKWTRFGLTGKASTYFSGRELSGLYIMDSVIWTGNIYGMGLIRYDYTRDSVTRIGRKEGLLSENIFAITPDNKNNLFVSTQSGINYYNVATGETRTLLVDDGTIDWGFSFIQFFDTLNNRLVYGLNDRILIASEKLWEKPADDRMTTFIDEVIVNNSKMPFDSDTLMLNHNQRNISIQFTGINYSPNTTLQYAYKLSGLDKDWMISHESNTTNYSNLGPGKYTFLVRTKGKSGDWGPVNSSLHFIIQPAIWQTSWFWIIAGLAAGLTVFAIVRRRIQNIRKSADLKQKLAETEMLALRSQMNPHFIFNCLNAIDNLMQTNQPDKATTYLTRFAKLIRAVLENSKNNEVSFHKDLETLQLYLQLEQFRAGNKFSYELKADEELINGSYKIPPLIIQPFIENAILHGLMNKENEDRKLLIEASLKGSFICYSITDNGVGREKGFEIKERNRPEHVSYGIQITTERLQLHNQRQNEKDIIIRDLRENGLAIGTRIEVMIKIDH